MDNPTDAQMYLTKLNSETAGLKQLEKIYSADVHSLNNPEIAGLLRVAIGQSNLLLTKKGEQFRGFCQSHNGKKENASYQITNEDLAAFWEIIVAQIDDIKNIYSQIDDKKKFKPKEELEKRQAASPSASITTKTRVKLPVPLVKNVLNRTPMDGLEDRTMTEAVKVLSGKDKMQDKHPERRVKAALAGFEKKMMPIVKRESPSLRCTQLKQIIYNLWQKSEENPMNQKDD